MVARARRPVRGTALRAFMAALLRRRASMSEHPRPAHAAGLRSPATMVNLLVVRHAESEWNRDGRWQGQADPPLSSAGAAEARAAAAALGSMDCIVSSDLQRARSTAEIMADAAGVGPVIVDPRWRERDVGRWQGLTVDEIERDYPGALASGDRPPGWESKPVDAGPAPGRGPTTPPPEPCRAMCWLCLTPVPSIRLKSILDANLSASRTSVGAGFRCSRARCACRNESRSPATVRASGPPPPRSDDETPSAHPSAPTRRPPARTSRPCG